MLICDLHCDLPDKVIGDIKITSNNAHWSEDRLKNENIYVQVFASYVDKYEYDDPFDRVNSLILNFKEKLKETDIGLVYDYKTLEENIKRKKNSAILAIEGAEALGGRIERVKYFYDLGVRFITITWNHKNQLGSSSSPYCENTSLTEFGRQVIKEMNKYGITPDVSHLSEKGFWDVIKISQKPVVATHSNAKRICNHVRNITDEQFLAIKNSGGVVGINFVPDFLENDGKTAGVMSIIRHIEHFMSLGGENTLVLGADFDGTDALPCEVSGIQDVEKIADELAKINYQDEIIAKIMGKNLQNYIKNVLL